MIICFTLPIIGELYDRNKKFECFVRWSTYFKRYKFVDKGRKFDYRNFRTKCSKIHTESMIHYLEDYMYCTRKLGLYVQLVA